MNGPEKPASHVHLGDKLDPEPNPKIKIQTSPKKIYEESRDLLTGTFKATTRKTLSQRISDAVSTVRANFVSTGTPISVNGKTLSKAEHSFISSLVNFTKLNPTKKLSNDEIAYAREMILTVDNIAQLEEIARQINPNFDEDFGKMTPRARIDRIRDRILGQVGGNKQSLHDRVNAVKSVVDDGRTIQEKAEAANDARSKVSDVLKRVMLQNKYSDTDGHLRLGIFGLGVGNIEHSAPVPGGKIAWDFSRPTSLDELIEDMEKPIHERMFMNPYGLSVENLKSLKASGAEIDSGAQAGEVVSLRLLRSGKDNANAQLQLIRHVERDEKAKILGQVADEWFGIDVETSAFQVSREVAAEAGSDMQEIIDRSRSRFFDQAKLNTSAYNNMTVEDFKTMFKGDNARSNRIYQIFNGMVDGEGPFNPERITQSHLEKLRRAGVAYEIDSMLDNTQFLPRITQASGGRFKARNTRTGIERLAAQLSGWELDGEMVDIIGESKNGRLSPQQMSRYLDRLEQEASRRSIYGINVVKADMEWIRQEAYLLAQEATASGDQATARRLLSYSGDMLSTDAKDMVAGEAVGHFRVLGQAWDVQKDFRRFFPAVDSMGDNALRKKAIDHVGAMSRYEAGLIFHKNSAGQRWMAGDVGKTHRNALAIAQDLESTVGRDAADNMAEQIMGKGSNIDMLKTVGDDATAYELIDQFEEKFLEFMTLTPGDDVAVRYGDDAISRSLGNIAHSGAGASADFVRLSFFDEVVKDISLVRQLRHEAKQDVKFIAFMMQKARGNFAQNGEMVSQVMNISRADADLLEEAQKQAGGTFQTIVIGASRNEKYPTMGLRSSYIPEDIKILGQETYNLVDKARALQRIGEYNKVGDKLGNPFLATSIGQELAEKYGHRAAEMAGKEFDDIVLAANKFARRGMVAALVGTAAIVGATKIKSNMREDDTWRYSKNTFTPDQVKTMEQRLNDARMGNLTIATHSNRNYSHNMRQDKHNHLFGGR